MKMSELATKTLHQAPADETAKNAQLLIKAGYINKEMAGVYSFLPLGLIVLNNIMAIIREEMNAIGGQEVLLSGLQNPAPWQASGRWDDTVVDIWFKTKLKGGQEIGLGNTHEEALTSAMINHIQSYKDLPVYVYQLQTKFRNELRAKSGLMRTREFIMKDLYSFCRSEEEHEKFYQHCQDAYTKIFKRVGLGEQTYLTFASGGSFSKFSHEFQTVCEAGEDTIYVSREHGLAVNAEVMNNEVLAELKLDRGELEEAKAAEVGNIFSLGTKYSDAIGLRFSDEHGHTQPVVMGSYGIGPARVMAVITELMADEHGLVWPEAVAPYKYHLIGLGSAEAVVQAEEVYRGLSQAGQGVLFDDRDERAGTKLADADLIGLPVRLVVSDKTKQQIEYKKRSSPQTHLLNLNQLIKGE